MQQRLFFKDAKGNERKWCAILQGSTPCRFQKNPTVAGLAAMVLVEVQATGMSPSSESTDFLNLWNAGLETSNFF